MKNAAWVANPIDAFVLASLESKGLSPNPPADKRELVRRLYYDLTGLPPTPAEVEAFVADRVAGGLRCTRRSLARSRRTTARNGAGIGSIWFAMPRRNSYERDDPKPNVWRYRDYVIRSLNDDKPYDQFVREQLAGDELSTPTTTA